MWVHRRSEDPSPTDVISYWIKPKLSAVGTTLRFISAQNLSTTKSSQAQIVLPSTSAASFLEDVINVAKDNELPGLLAQYNMDTTDKFDNLSLHKLLCLFYKDDSTTDCNDFLSFCESKITNKLCKEVERLTRGQHEQPLWHEMRYGRITASKLFEFAHCHAPDGALVQSMIGAYKVRDTIHMKRGRILEKAVLDVVMGKTKLKFVKCGFFILPHLPIFGASPDALSSEYVVEVKCPSSKKTLKSYILERQITNKYKAQIHLQMLCANKRKGLFCVAEPDFEQTKNVTIIFVNYDEKFITNLVNNSLENWKMYIYPKLFNSVL